MSVLSHSIAVPDSLVTPALLLSSWEVWITAISLLRFTHRTFLQERRARARTSSWAQLRLSLCPLGPLEAALASGAGDPHFIWPFALRFSLGWGPAGEAPRRQLGFQRTGVIFKACLPCVCADKGCLCRESTTYTVGPMQISANDNIIIRLRKQRQ